MRDQDWYNLTDIDPNDRPRPQPQSALNWSWLLAPIPWILLAVWYWG